MNNILMDNSYWLMIMQVLITLVIVPIISFTIFTKIAKSYNNEKLPQAQEEISKHIKSSTLLFTTVSAFCLAFSVAVIVLAISNQTELFNWDNQAGLMILFLIAVIPIISMALKHKMLYAIIAKYTNKTRSASLVPRSFSSMLSTPLVVLIGIAHMLVILSILYFTEHPFEGFAGFNNLWGVVMLDGIFMMVLININNSRKFSAINHPGHRLAIKVKMMKINLLIWALALFNISISLWIASMQIEIIKLLTQSLYLQIMIVLMAYSLTLPKLAVNEFTQEEPLTSH